MVELGSIKVSKIDAARRQLDTAIELWFGDKDPVSIHTLAAAAHQIVHDINNQRGGPELFFDSSVIKDEYRTRAIALFKKPMNFFKHADKDAYEIVDLAHVATLFFMLITLMGFQYLGERLTDVERALVMWISFNHPEWINAAYKDTLQKAVPIDVQKQIRGLNKGEFLNAFLLARTGLFDNLGR